MPLSSAPSFCEKAFYGVVYEHAYAVRRRLPLDRIGVDHTPGAVGVGR
jgi:hypothetical protein